MVFNLFDPWRSRLCTCPKKYSLNPYTGCSHACIYCYITSYIPQGHRARVKKRLFTEINRELPRLDKRLPVTMSNSSDPYPPIEKKHKITRRVLKKLSSFRVQVITKGSLVARDADLLAEMRSSVAVSVTTLDEDTAGKLEPYAPPPDERLRAMEKLISEGIEVSCRMDPIIPSLNEDCEGLIRKLSAMEVSHITSSTFKPRYDSWRRFRLAFPELGEKLAKLYFEQGRRRQNSFFLPREVRLKLMKKLAKECKRHGLSFSTCREGLNLNTSPSCDGTHLIG